MIIVGMSRLVKILWRVDRIGQISFESWLDWSEVLPEWAGLVRMNELVRILLREEKTDLREQVGSEFLLEWVVLVQILS